MEAAQKALHEYVYRLDLAAEKTDKDNIYAKIDDEKEAATKQLEILAVTAKEKGVTEEKIKADFTEGLLAIDEKYANDKKDIDEKNKDIIEKIKRMAGLSRNAGVMQELTNDEPLDD